MAKKTGRLSKSEMAYITENAEMDPDAIAKQLNRSPEPIVKYLAKIGAGSDKRHNLRTQAEYDIKSRPYWKQLQNQFDEDELEILLYHWKEIISQFQRDILPTEEMQIVDMVKLDVLMNRALNTQRSNQLAIQALQEEVRQERTRPEEDREMDLIFDLTTQISNLQAAHESLSKDYKDLQEKKFKMFEAMKATRAARIQKLESNKETLEGLIRKINNDQQFRADCNREMELMRLAVEKEKSRLADFHTYEDGEVDQPFLTPETVILDGQV